MAKKTKDKMDKKMEAKFKKQKEKYVKALDEELNKLSKMNLAEFKKGVVKQIKDIHESFFEFQDEICLVWDFFAEQRDNLVGGVKICLDERDKLLREAFEERDKRLDTLDVFVFVDAIKLMCHIENGPISYETKKGLSEFLGYDFDKTRENFIASKMTPSPA